MIWQAIEANLKSITSCELKSLVSIVVQKVLSQIYKSIRRNSCCNDIVHSTSCAEVWPHFWSCSLGNFVKHFEKILWWCLPGFFLKSCRQNSRKLNLRFIVKSTVKQCGWQFNHFLKWKVSFFYWHFSQA